MTIAGAGASDHHVVDGVVILLPDVDRVALLQLLVAEGVELGEGHPQVGRLEQVLHLLAVGVEAGGVELDVGGQHSVDHLTLGGGGQAGVAGLTHNLVQLSGHA